MDWDTEEEAGHGAACEKLCLVEEEDDDDDDGDEGLLFLSSQTCCSHGSLVARWYVQCCFWHTHVLCVHQRNSWQQ